MLKLKRTLSRRLRKAVIAIAISFFILILAIYPDRYVKTTYDGIILWAVCVLPSLLPYFFLTALLTRTGVLKRFSKLFNPLTEKLFKLSGISFYVFLMSVISGYPVGSKLIADLYENNVITQNEAKKMSVLCSTSGPLFVIGAIGTTMFGNKTVGFIIYLAHVLSALISGIIFRNIGDLHSSNATAKNYAPPPNNDVLYECVYGAVTSSLIVGGFVSIFYVLSEVLLDFGILSPFTYLFSLALKPLGGTSETAKAISMGLIEFTKGCKLISTNGANLISVSTACFLVSFGGLSVIMQSITFLQKSKVSPAFFIIGKLLQAVISAIISVILYFLII